MAEKLTTIPVSVATNERIKKLAAARAKKMGVSTPFTQRVYLEILITEEEERAKNETNR